MTDSPRDYRSLKVWQAAMALVTRCYEITQSFPQHEIYGLTSQLRRAAVSIPANLAEGHERDSTKDYLRFVSIALGSAAELQTLLQIARNLKYAEPWTLDEVTASLEEISRMLRGLQKSLKQKLDA